MNMEVHYSSASNEWATPQPLFDELHAEFGFTLDPCATSENAKCETYFTREDDGLKQSWAGYRVFCNPPYGRQIGKWVRKAYEESVLGATVVCLIPARTDTHYWHDYVMKGEVRFLRGRVYFEQPGKVRDRAPFPSAVVIFRDSSKPAIWRCADCGRELHPSSLTRVGIGVHHNNPDRGEGLNCGTVRRV